jgi:dephospho-CoA kinase
MNIIGIAGTNGSGKDTVGRVLSEQCNYLFISVTDILRDELMRRGLPVDREHMRELSAEWRRQYGLGVLIDQAVKQYEIRGGNFIGLACASLRNPGEADRVHELGGKVVWVDATPQVRYNRIQANADERGAARAVNDRKTFEQFMADEQAEMHASGDAATLSMADVKTKSDIFVENNGSDMEAFAQEIKAARAL